MEQVNLNSHRSVKNKLKTIKLNYMWASLFLIGCALVITMTTFYIQPGSMLRVLQLIEQQPLILVVNFIPVLLFIVLFYFCTNNVFYSAAITGGLFNLLSFINRLKTIARDDPFVPRDVQLLQEALNTVSDLGADLDLKLMALIILAAAVCIILGIIFKTNRLSKKIRLIGAVICVLIMLLANKMIYSSKDVYYHKLHVSNRSYISKVYSELGFTYNFLYNLNTYPIEKPENFSKSEVESWIKEYTGTDAEEPDVKPHVIIVMNEAFSDIANDEKFAYTEENSPLKYFNALTKDEHSISGHIVVPGFGGGTANTEYDVLTGMQTNLLNSVATSAFRVVGRSINTIPRFLMHNGYQSLYMHPGQRWFYNRSSVYKYFGISEQIFSEAFTKADYKGNMVSDKVLTERFLEQFKERTSGADSKPLFTYITSIQNHMSYTVNKYGDLPIEEVPVKKAISQEAKDFFSVYMEGVKDADQMLEDLKEYFESIDEPVVLVFYGDHLPNLGDNYLSYKELGLNVGNDDTVENVINTYSTPYIIWANDAAAKAINFEEAKTKLQLPADGRISANYLGAALTELLGYEGQDAYYDFLNDMRREIPIVWKNYYETTETGYTQELTEDQKALVDKMHKWEYYKMKMEKVNME